MLAALLPRLDFDVLLQSISEATSEEMLNQTHSALLHAADRMRDQSWAAPAVKKTSGASNHTTDRLWWRHKIESHVRDLERQRKRDLKPGRQGK